MQLGYRWAVVFGNVSDAQFSLCQPSLVSSQLICYACIDATQHDTAPCCSIKSNTTAAAARRSVQSITTRAQLMAYDRSLPLSVSQAGDPVLHGVSNYMLPVYANDSSLSPVAALYFLDRYETLNARCIVPYRPLLT